MSTVTTEYSHGRTVAVTYRGRRYVPGDNYRFVDEGEVIPLGAEVLYLGFEPNTYHQLFWSGSNDVGTIAPDRGESGLLYRIQEYGPVKKDGKTVAYYYDGVRIEPGDGYRFLEVGDTIESGSECCTVKLTSNKTGEKIWVQSLEIGCTVAATEKTGLLYRIRDGVNHADRLLKYFSYSHLPEELKGTSRQFFDLAFFIVRTLEPGPERTVALRKLLEAKDAAVRAKLHPGG